MRQIVDFINKSLGPHGTGTAKPQYHAVIVDNNCNVISETSGSGSDGNTEMCHSDTTGRPFSGGASVTCSQDNV